MTPDRFQAITESYAKLRIGLIGDFCLDRYLEIDPEKAETSIETGLPVYNVVRVRAQPGGAGTILNNLAALGIGAIYPVGFAGLDGEGFELRQALAEKPGVHLDKFIQTPMRRTFTYCKPLMMGPGRPPVELNRLDSKNWTPTPIEVGEQFDRSLRLLAETVDAMILLSQVDVPETGVITSRVLGVVESISASRPALPIIADSRTGLAGYPPVCLKMNRAELQRLGGSYEAEADKTPLAPVAAESTLSLSELLKTASNLARKQGRMVFITLAEQGILGASPEGEARHVPALPVRGEIDIVGAGDAVTANLAAALAGGATLNEALVIANAAASIVIHQLGTTGTACIEEIRKLTT